MYLLKSLACHDTLSALYIPFYNFMTLFQEDFLEERRIKRMYWIHQYEQEPIKIYVARKCILGYTDSFLFVYTLLSFFSYILGVFPLVLE